MKTVLSLSLIVGVCVLSGCASTMSNLNRRPYADKVDYIAFSDQNAAGAKSVGVQTYESCSRRFQLGFFILGSDPTYDELKKKIVEEEKVKAMKNVKSVEYGSSGFLLGKTCIAFEGEALK